VQAVETMRSAGCKFRVLGLSATPGSDGAKVQARPQRGWQAFPVLLRL
jgi:ERCC4-related helicase